MPLMLTTQKLTIICFNLVFEGLVHMHASKDLFISSFYSMFYLCIAYNDYFKHELSEFLL